MPNQDAPPPDKNHRVTSPATLVGGSLILIIGACILAGAINLFLDINQEAIDAEPSTRIFAYYGLFGIPIVLLALALIMLIIGSVRWAIHGRDGELADNPRQNRELLESINERLLLSDTAKRIAYRHEDIALLRRTIQHDIEKHDFDAAMVLVQEIGQTYGYVEEAEAYRDEINQARTAEIESKVAQAIGRLDEMITSQNFDPAMQEALKIQRLYPSSTRVKDLHRRVSDAREQYKQDLERQFLEAAKRDEVDQAMALLKKLDKYLSEKEAAPFRETARGVIGQKRDNLGVQFKLAIHDREWLLAVRIGEQIIREFPNTRMADEVRGWLDKLRENAANQSAANPRDPTARTRVSDQV